MSWRIVVIAKRSKLDLQLGYLVVRGEAVQKIHLSEISLLMIENTAVSLTAALLAELVRLKIKVVFCDEKRNPSAELLPYYGAHDTSAKIRQQVAWKKETKGAVWAEIVRNKIRNQADLLAFAEKEESVLLYQYLTEIEADDRTNREGHAAKVYFNALLGKGFSRADSCAINAALNYGYTILLSACNREIVSNGYITQLGIHHCNVDNMFNLGSDLMEPFRAFVDARVFALWMNGDLEIFGHKQKMEVVSVLNAEIQVNEKIYNLDYALKIFVKSVLDAMHEDEMSGIAVCGFLK